MAINSLKQLVHDLKGEIPTDHVATISMTFVSEEPSIRVSDEDSHTLYNILIMTTVVVVQAIKPKEVEYDYKTFASIPEGLDFQGPNEKASFAIGWVLGGFECPRWLVKEAINQVNIG